MKRISKFAAVVLALALMFALCSTAFAATVSVPENLDGHSFVAYQIFTGTQAESEGALGDVEWGSGINYAAFLAALQADAGIGEKYAQCVTAKDVAEVLADNTADAEVFAKLAYENKSETCVTLSSGENELADGYYLIVDTSLGSDDGDIAAYNAALLQVTDNIVITVKTDAPGVEKKVLENVKHQQDDGYGIGYNDVADYNIGDTVAFAFYSEVPDMSYFETYSMVFHDVMSAGLSFDPQSVTVTIGGNAISGVSVNTNPGDGCTFDVVIEDLKAIDGIKEGDKIIVSFSATLNEKAVIGLPGNPNKVCLEYSNNPNESASDDENNTGTTEWDEVIVFTYELDVTKTDGEKALSGAEFVLYNEAGKYAVIDANARVSGWTENKDEASVLVSDIEGLFKVVGLDDGVYYLEETKAPAGYNKLTEAIKLVVTATTANGQSWSDGDPAKALTAITISIDEADAQVGDTASGAVSATVINKAGATLPETGGIGTTLFYSVGSLLVFVAVAFFVTKRRMKTEG